ncbi:MAG TPA: hypothetical protein VJJ20_01700 [Candidatus Paceibacterota bacterium]
MRNTAVLAAKQAEEPRRALWLARCFLGDEYDEEALPAEIVCALYIPLSIVVVTGAIMIGWLFYLIGHLIFDKIYGG